MSKFALDTNIVSYYLKDDNHVAEKLNNETDNNNAVVIPPMVYYEIKKWLILNNSKTKLSVFEGMCAYCGIGSIEKEHLEEAARIYADLRRNGITLEDNDILIAVYCLRNGLTLVTNNIKHFQHIPGLRLVNWMEQ